MKLKVYQLIVIAIFLCSCGSSKTSKPEIIKKWEQVFSSDDSKPVKRHEAAFVNVGDKFYLLGGRGIRPVSIFDPLTRVWTKGKKPPIEFHHFQPVVSGNKVYIIGALTGRYPAETPVPNVYVYNVDTDSWSKGDAIPVDRLRGSTGNVLKGDLVYISCGIKDGHRSDHKNWMDTYNLKTGEWKTLPNAPRARDHFQAVEAKNKIYLLGGRLSKAPKRTFHETIPEVDVYDIATKTWSTLENNLPTQRAGNMAMLYGDEILVIGGESINQPQAHSEVEALNINTLTWKKYPFLKQGRHGTGVFGYKNFIYVASGSGNRGGSPELETIEKY